MDVQMLDASPVTGLQTTLNHATSHPGSSSLTPATPAASSGVLDAAKLDAIRKATLHSYKNKFLNLRDKFDKINAVCDRSYGIHGSPERLQTNVEYTNTLSSAKKKEEGMQEEIK